VSTEHEVRIVRLGDIRKHENADTLGITEVDGRPCIVRLAEWAAGDVALYVPIDSLVPVEDPRFAFLAAQRKPDESGRVRIRSVRLRGAFSMGLLVSPPFDLDHPDFIGTDVRERMGIGIYEPPVPPEGGETEADPGFLPVYDIESVRKWGPSVLVEGEEVVLTEKIHGANGRFAWHRDRLWCASRTQFYKPGEGMWSRVAEIEGLAEKLARVCPGVAIYGEVYGKVQNLHYGKTGANLVAFDALDIDTRRWLDHDEFIDLAERLGLPRVPELYRGTWSPDLSCFAEGDSPLADFNGERHVREGWVVKPVRERSHPELGRVILKLHGEGYLTRKEA
jgi:RNA ligase (TIGR02306 family)